MRVLHINCNYILSNLHQTMVDNLIEQSVDSEVFVATYDKERSIVDVNPYVRVAECFKKWERLFFFHKQRKIIRTAEKLYDIKEYDFLHAYTLFTDGNTAMKLSKKYGIPYVVAIRNTDVNDFFRLMPHLRGRGIKIMREASAVFFLSEAYRRQVFEKYVPEKYREELMKKTRIIPNGIDDFWLENSACDEKMLDASGEIKLVYAGRIDKNKNIPTTQAAMKILRKRGYKTSLTVVGKVDDSSELERIKEDKNTRYVEPMPKEELIDKYREADIFVMPSHTESFGLVYAEAMSQGLPVIYSKGQGFDKQFDEGVVGFGVDSHDVLSVANGIEKVIKTYSSIRTNVVVSAKKFNWKNIASEYVKIYRENLK